MVSKAGLGRVMGPSANRTGSVLHDQCIKQGFERPTWLHSKTRDMNNQYLSVSQCFLTILLECARNCYSYERCNSDPFELIKYDIFEKLERKENSMR